MSHTHSCGASWCGHQASHCASCHETFNSNSAYDRHRVRLKCVSPADRGLTRNRRGLWAAPGRAEFAPTTPPEDAHTCTL